MTKKIYSLLLFAISLSPITKTMGHQQCLNLPEKYYDIDEYEYDLHYNLCRCHRFKWFTGLQVFAIGDFVFDNSDGSTAYAFNNRVDAYMKACAENYIKLVAQRKQKDNKDSKKDEHDTDHYLNAVSSEGMNFGGGFGLRYMFGKMDSGFALYTSLAYRKVQEIYFNKSKAQTAYNFYKNKIQDPKQYTDIINQQKEKDKTILNDINSDKNYMLLPEEIEFTTWILDFYLERLNAWFGELHRCENNMRQSFVLLFTYSFGVRFYLWQKITDDIYSVAQAQPPSNLKHIEENINNFSFLIKASLQFMFRQGIFFELASESQLMPFIKNDLDGVFENFEELLGKRDALSRLKSTLSSFSPTVKLSIGFDFYALCCSKKVEEYYDN